jgi:hypothetical protein
MFMIYLNTKFHTAMDCTSVNAGVYGLLSPAASA